jgi:SAM-dependent methyltransferase
VAAYDSAFYRYINDGAARSARSILPLVLNTVNTRSVLDVGCGQGAWLSVWRELGVSDAIGIDGAYVDLERILVPRDSFLSQDLARPFELKRRFDLVQSLEVAEHLPPERATDFVASLVRHADLILFSAAPPGQGGDNHLNEQPYDYWRSIFAKHDYVALDFIRPRVRDDNAVEPWYRYNTLIYASKARLPTLPAALQHSRVPDDAPVPDFSPPIYRLRKALTAALPIPVATGIARIKEHVAVWLRAL